MEDVLLTPDLFYRHRFGARELGESVKYIILTKYLFH